MKRLLALAALLLALTAAPALAASSDEEVPPRNGTTELEATRAADAAPAVAKERRENGSLASTASFQDGHWQIAYFDDDEEVAVVYVDAHKPEVIEEWTGFQVAWKMARGYSGAFGHALNSPFVFVPLCLIFLLGLFDWRRWRRVANLDLLFLLGFTASHFFFNRAEIGISVPLQYPPLVYLLARALWIGFRGRGEGLRPVWPTAWLVIAALFLLGVRVGLNVANAGAIDVGYAGVVGADKIVHGEPLYDNFPDDIRSGDTYGPVNYLAYVPFELIWPYSGEWDDLPAAHAAGVVFDLAVLGFLVLLGLRIRPGPAGRRLAAILAFGWTAYPYTAYVLESNSNDSLLAALLVAILLVLARPFARGVTLSLATFAKFVPAVLGPMLLTYRPPGETRRLPRTALLFAAGFVLVGVAAMLWPAIDPGLRTVFDRSLGAQTGRSSPFSVWGQANLEWLHTLLLAALAALALALAFVPRRKSLLQVAALSAALVIGVQLTLHHWFYLYIVWFYPLLLVALALLERAPGAKPGGGPALNPTAAAPAPSPARSGPPAPAR
ncbi:MAG TPA: glycosyltransferase 87 family protein [Solirubrobacterales bacterium]|nr:glycosyltransferase 87 family protein [Solirubrobacterales bacterium]